MFLYGPDSRLIGFDQYYLKRRGWSATATLPSILRNTRWIVNKDSPSEILDLSQELGEKNIDTVFSFWLGTNCQGRWDKIGRDMVEFELESDAMMYKLIWGDYL